MTEDRRAPGGEAADLSTVAEENRRSAERSETELRTAGQRQVNLIWETTQQRIALWVIAAALSVACVLAVAGKMLGTTVDVQLAAIVFLFGVANLVTGFYFGRTNHTRSGGVGGDAIRYTR